MMTNQLCVTAGRGSADLEKAVLSLPVPLKFLVPTRRFKSVDHIECDRASSDWGGV